MKFSLKFRTILLFCILGASILAAVFYPQLEELMIKVVDRNHQINQRDLADKRDDEWRKKHNINIRSNREHRMQLAIKKHNRYLLNHYSIESGFNTGELTSIRIFKTNLSKRFN